LIAWITPCATRQHKSLTCHEWKDTTQNIQHELTALLASYDTTDILTTIAALHLMPENAGRSCRLDVLACAAIARPACPGATAIGRRHRRRLLNSAPLADDHIAERESSVEDAFTQELAFYDGSFLVFSGPDDEALFILRHLISALFLHPEPFPHSSFLDEARTLITAILAVGDAVARRARLERGIDPAPFFPGDDVIVPSRRRLARLKCAVTFGRATLVATLAAHGIHSRTLDAVTIPLADVTSGDTGEGPDVLRARPVVAMGDAHIVVAPHMLLTAARHALLRLADALGVREEVAGRYHAAVWATVVESLDGMSLPLLGAPVGAPDIPHATDGVFDLDADKVLHALVVTDGCATYDPQAPHGAWPVDDLGARIARRLRAVQDSVFGAPDPPAALLSLVLVQGIGRTTVVSIDEPAHEAARCLVLSAADLRTIALLERDDPLALWAYAGAAVDARRRAAVLADRPLDEFYGYRALGYAYPPTGDEPDAVICMPPYGAGELRRELYRTHDWHGAPYGGGVIEVTTVYGTPAQPIYTPVSTGGQQIAFLVEGLPLPFWATSPLFDSDDDRMRTVIPRYLQLCDVVAYYIWRCTPSLHPLLRPLADAHDCLYVLFHLPPDVWDSPNHLLSPSPEQALSVDIDADQGMVVLTVNPTFNAVIERPDNGGERLIVRHIVRGLSDLLRAAGARPWSDETIDGMLDRHTPLGFQKRLSAIGDLRTPDLDPRGVSGARTLHLPTMQALRHDLRARLRTRLDASGMHATASKRELAELLKMAVVVAYDALEECVASLDPSGLLEALVAQHEALTLRRARGRLSMPPLAAGLTDMPEQIEKERMDVDDAVRASVALRFVIEYVAARPPTGRVPISLGAYDHLLAIAMHIIETGAESDLIHYELIDVGSAPLSPAEWLERRAPYTGAMEDYAALYAAGETARLTRAYASHWPASDGGEDVTGGDDEPSGLIASIDLATRAEWGLPLTEILACLGVLGDIGRAVDPGVATLPRYDLIDRLVADLSWPRAHIEHALDLLSLGKRQNSEYKARIRPISPCQATPHIT